ncbi:MAG: hypothetical protein JW856_02920 [Dehalococcoidales bacterium]|nr:hypothetical protein [Dehalococcoidales bacterium]
MAHLNHSDTTEKIESITFINNLKDSGDMESNTRTITAAAEAAGTGNADYSFSTSLTKPVDTRLEILRIAARISATIDSITATHVYCRVYVDQQDADHRLFDEDWTAAGAKVVAVDTHTDNKPAVFNLLNDGSAHTFYIFLWVDTGNAVISLMKIQTASGSTCSTAPGHETVVRINHAGGISFSGAQCKDGSGTPSSRFYISKDSSANVPYSSVNGNDAILTASAWGNCPFVKVKGTVATDLNWIYAYSINLRSEP